MDLATVADELYGLPPHEFIPARQARAREARAHGDRSLATEIQRLAKPTTSAWLVNQVTRQLGEHLAPLVDLGRELRSAGSTLGREELHELTRQRHQLVQALVRESRRLGRASGHPVSDGVATEVQQTLEASLADESLAEEMLRGQLTRPLAYAGFGGPAGAFGADNRQAPPPTTGRAVRSDDEVADLDAHRRQAAERAVADAAAALARATAAHADADQAVDRALGQVREAEEAVLRIEGQLSTARGRAERAHQREQAAREQLSATDHRLREARRAHDEARAALGPPAT